MTAEAPEVEVEDTGEAAPVTSPTSSNAFRAGHQEVAMLAVAVAALAFAQP